MAEEELPVTAAHRAIQELVDKGDLLLSWHLTFEAVTPRGQKWIGHRSGGGHDGTEAPMIWSVIGLLEAALASCHDQLADLSREPWPEDDSSEEDEES
jgi:hypothetical protein